MTGVQKKWANEPKLVLGIDLEEYVALGICLRNEAGDCANVDSIKGAFK